MDNVIDLTDDTIDLDSIMVQNISDEEDEDLKLAIALSLQSEEPEIPIRPHSRSQSSQRHNEPPVTAPSSLLGIDRKAMEAERLARLKRKRTDNEDNPNSDLLQPPTTKSKPSPSPPSQKQQIGTNAFTITSSSRANTTREFRVPSDPVFSFPQGKVILTATPSRYSPGTTTLEAISFPDILKPPPLQSPSPKRYTLKSALLSSFIIDFDWLFQHFQLNGPTATKFVLVLHTSDNQHRKGLHSDFEGLKPVRLVTPDMKGGSFGTMHSKLMLLFFGTSDMEKTSTPKDEICRIVVPSANLVPYDWGVGRIMENILYVVDLPLKTEQQQNATSTGETLFQTQLKAQLSAMGVPADVLRKLANFDFSATRDTGFVHTISGSQALSPAPSMSKNFEPPIATGLLALSETLASLGLSIPDSSPAYPPQLDFVTSSLGNLSPAFLRQLYQAVCGTLDANTIANKPAKRGGAKKTVGTTGPDPAAADNVVKQNLRIYFPSSRTIRNSKGGEPSAGTIRFQKKWWEENEMIQHCLRDCVGARGDGILMHSKILYTTFKQPISVKGANETSRMCLGWAYVGSANLSESAWGRITSDAKSKVPKMTSRNWESGVVVPLFADDNHLVSHLEDGKDHVSSEIPIPSEKEGAKTSAAVEKRGCRVSEEKRPGYTTGKGTGQEGVSSLPNRRKLQENNGSSETTLAVGEIFAGSIPTPVRTSAQSLAVMGLEPWFFKD